jgi:hypothetical protein
MHPFALGVIIAGILLLGVGLTWALLIRRRGGVRVGSGKFFLVTIVSSLGGGLIVLGIFEALIMRA